MFEDHSFNTRDMELCRRNDSVSGMLMDITLVHLMPNDCKKIHSRECESAILLLEGMATVSYCGFTKDIYRSSVFKQKPYCIHVPCDTVVELTAKSEVEILIQQTDNENVFEPHFYTPEDCKVEILGKNQWEGTSYREVLTVFDYSNAPYSNMVLGEVITKPGRWSSYIPHSHPQPEVYYYKFDRTQGFGACFIGDKVNKIMNGSVAMIPGGLVHPQVTAPGYTMYYCWMIRHLKGNPWTTRDYDPKHSWLLTDGGR